MLFSGNMRKNQFLFFLGNNFILGYKEKNKKKTLVTFMPIRPIYIKYHRMEHL